MLWLVIKGAKPPALEATATSHLELRPSELLQLGVGPKGPT